MQTPGIGQDHAGTGQATIELPVLLGAVIWTWASETRRKRRGLDAMSLPPIPMTSCSFPPNTFQVPLLPPRASLLASKLLYPAEYIARLNCTLTL